jgi:PAS domain S-box-containing protein
MLGYAEEELLQLRMQDITHPEDLPANLVQFHELVAGGPDFEVEKRYLRKDGSELWVSNRVNAIRDAAGKPQSVVASSMDVTERKRAEQALRESEARKAAMLNASLDGIITIEQNGRILEFNPAAERIFGYRRDEVVGKEMATLIVPPALQGRHRRGLQRYLATGEGPMLDRRIEMIAMRHDCSEFPVELAIVRRQTFFHVHWLRARYHRACASRGRDESAYAAGAGRGRSQQKGAGRLRSQMASPRGRGSRRIGARDRILQGARARARWRPTCAPRRSRVG